MCLVFLVLFTRKMCATCRAAASPAIRTMDRTEWLLHEALPWPEPKRSDDGHDVMDANATMQLLLQPTNVCS